VHSHHNHGAENESLQADVMRFMAIIGFCLVAILALVRNVEAPAVETEAKPSVEQPTVAARPAEPRPATTPTPAPRRPVAELLSPAAESPSTIEPPPAIEVLVEPAQVAAEVIEPPEPTFTAEVIEQALEPEVVATAPPLEDVPNPTAESEPTQPSAEEPGLSLRFSSDGDFLRLIARGDVTVFAVRGAEVLGLGQDYEFRQTEAPKQIYELEFDTIPRMVSQAFVRSRPETQLYTWGVSLPHRIESQIRDYVDRVDHGVLLIDRYGDVRHVGAS